MSALDSNQKVCTKSPENKHPCQLGARLPTWLLMTLAG